MTRRLSSSIARCSASSIAAARAGSAPSRRRSLGDRGLPHRGPRVLERLIDRCANLGGHGGTVWVFGDHNVAVADAALAWRLVRRALTHARVDVVIELIDRDTAVLAVRSAAPVFSPSTRNRVNNDPGGTRPKSLRSPQLRPPQRRTRWPLRRQRYVAPRPSKRPSTSTTGAVLGASPSANAPLWQQSNIAGIDRARLCCITSRTRPSSYRGGAQVLEIGTRRCEVQPPGR